MRCSPTSTSSTSCACGPTTSRPPNPPVLPQVWRAENRSRLTVTGGKSCRRLCRAAFAIDSPGYRFSTNDDQTGATQVGDVDGQVPVNDEQVGGVALGQLSGHTIESAGRGCG